MKRYLIFAALGPFLGGFFLLVATTVMSGYWDEPSWSQVTKLFVVFLKTLQYSYLFGILPILMMAAVDDIVFHVKRIVPVLRMLLVGVFSFLAAVLIDDRPTRRRTIERRIGGAGAPRIGRLSEIDIFVRHGHHMGNTRAKRKLRSGPRFGKATLINAPRPPHAAPRSRSPHAPATSRARPAQIPPGRTG